MSIGSGYLVFSDIYQIDSIVRNTAMMAGRNLLIDTLREMFRRDREYRYVTDRFGYPKTPNHNGLSLDDGRENDLTTRLFIGGTHRQDISYLPAITVRSASTSYAPISFNQNEQTVTYSTQKVVDGYGNQTLITAPSAMVFAGAWEQSFEVRVTGRSLEDVLSIGDIILVGLQNTYRHILRQSGLFVKSVSSSGTNDETIGEADPIFSTSIMVNTYSEWRREIPVSTLVDRINLCFEVNISNEDIPASSMTGRISIS